MVLRIDEYTLYLHYLYYIYFFYTRNVVRMKDIN